MLTTTNDQQTVKRWTTLEMQEQFKRCQGWNDPQQWEALAVIYYTHGYLLNSRVCFENAEKSKAAKVGISPNSPNYEKPEFKSALQRYLAAPGTFRSARNFAAELLHISRKTRDADLRSFCVKMSVFIKEYSKSEPLWEVGQP